MQNDVRLLAEGSPTRTNDIAPRLPPLHTARSPRCLSSGSLIDLSGNGLTDGMKQTFYAMETRRIERMLNGRVRRQGWFSFMLKALQFLCVFSVIIRVFNVQVQEKNKFAIVPWVLTVLLILLTLYRTYLTPEHIFPLWLEVEVSIYTLWIMWDFNPLDTNSSIGFVTQDERGILIAATVTIGITLLLWCLYIFFVRCVLHRCFYLGGYFCWWGVRLGTADERGFCLTYRPHGPSCLRRAQCGYKGDVDAFGRPHGQGHWFDNSFHGECLRGQWIEGRPAGTFQSREYGTGAHFSQLPIAYATSRADCQPDRLDVVSSVPTRGAGLRFGIAHVEVSRAGGFFPFLPRVAKENHCTKASVDAVVQEMTGDVSRRLSVHREQLVDKDHAITVSVKPHVNWMTPVQEVQSGCPSVSRLPSGCISLPVQFCDGQAGIECIVSEQNLHEGKRLAERQKEALVFIHGYNCSLSVALGRVAQIFALGGMPSHIVPFVFSYSGGKMFSYMSVKKHFREYGADFEAFLHDLAYHFKELHVVCHSSGADFFFSNFLLAKRALAPSRKQRDSETWRELVEKEIPERQMHLATLTLMNPDVLLNRVEQVLPSVMDFAEHFTTYNDTRDFALAVTQLIEALTCCKKTHRCCRKETLKLGQVARPIRVKEAEKGSGEPPNLSYGDARVGGASPVSSDASAAFRRNYLSFGAEDDMSLDCEWSSSIDVIDCSQIDQNVHNVRHNYYMLNTQMVEDLCELIGRRVVAKNRSRLVQVMLNVFHFLSPPSFLTE